MVGDRAEVCGDGSPPAGSRGRALVGELGAKSPKAEAFFNTKVKYAFW